VGVHVWVNVMAVIETDIIFLCTLTSQKGDNTTKKTNHLANALILPARKAIIRSTEIAAMPAIEIKNKKASYQYFLTEEFTAGIVLTGSEIKSIRAMKANIGDAYCKMRNGELFVINMYIGTYSNAGYSQHKERNERKLLLNKIELRKIDRKLRDAGITIVPTRMFINEKGFAKLDIALAKGKNVGDKRADTKDKDLRRENERGFE
jgi:SsrA-binding protein